MKKGIKLLLVVLIITTIFVGVYFLKGDSFKNSFFKSSFTKDIKENSAINISDLSKDFMDDYFDEYTKIKPEEKENMLIVTSLNEISDNYGATNVIKAPNNQYFLLYDSEEEKNNALDKFKSDNSIVNVDQNELVYFNTTNCNSWGIEKMALDTAVNTTNLRSNLPEIKVAIIDTGCDVDLVNKYFSGKIIETYNVLEDSTSIMNDTHGHGTHIAGTIAEGTPANVKIIPIKVSTGATQQTTDILTAINYIVYNDKADVINMSFGMYGYSNSLHDAIEAANQKNIISIAAAGNDNLNQKLYPAAFDNTISIASVDSQLIKSSFSNYGSTIDFTTPGTNIKSTLGKNMTLSKNTDGDDDFEVISGTSMATPHAVSAVAILKSYNKELTRNDVIELLSNYAVKDIGKLGKDEYYGNGFIYFSADSLCTNPQSGTCEDLGVFKSSAEIYITKIEPTIIRTDKNYGTVNNFNYTRIRITYSNENTNIANLGELSDVEIIGYDAYATEEQTITVKWKGLQTTFKFTNPTDWVSGWQYEVIDATTAKLTGYTDFNYGNYAAKKLYIPEKIDGYNIVDIANNNLNQSIFFQASTRAFEEIILPATVTKISGENTFEKFINLKKVTSKAPILRIVGNNVFSSNTNLTEIDGNLFIQGSSTFSGDSSLVEVTLSNNMIEIPTATFEECLSLVNIELPTNLLTIGESAFYNVGIVNLILPNNVKTIEDEAFYCTNIINLFLPNSVETIGNYAFYTEGNGKIKTITLSSRLKTIGNYAFANSLITEIDLPDSLETIGIGAFYNAHELESFNIPKNVISLGDNILKNCSKLETITVDSNNTVYDSRNNCNAIIETATNTLISGSSSTVIPNSVLKIGNHAFKCIAIEQIIIPESVTEIGQCAFNGSSLTKLNVPSSVVTIGVDAFLGKNDTYIIIWANTNSYAISYAKNNLIPYEATNQSYIGTSITNFNFNAFNTINIEDINVYAYFDQATNNGTYKEWKKAAGRQEIISSSNLEILYEGNRNSFRYGDTIFMIKGVTQYGEQFEKVYNVTISKAMPIYEVPNNLTATVGQKLSDISLPSGFTWVNPNTTISTTGKQIFKATYTPTDIVNYQTVENIDVSINVSGTNTKIILAPNIIVQSRVYDGTTTVDVANISVSNISASDYIIVSAVSSSADAGSRTATIKLKLTDEKFTNYSFDGGVQEKEFTVGFTILQKTVTKPTKSVRSYVYVGREITFDIVNYDAECMNVSNNKATNAGTYNTVISLKNSNYVWADNTRTKITLVYRIAKASIYVIDESTNATVRYDGQPHSINISLRYNIGTIVRYMDENGNYTLTSVPMYTNIGTYITKYKLYYSDNYTEYFGERTLTITANTVTNNSTDYEGVYDGNNHSININVEPSNYTIRYSIGSTEYNLTELPMFKDVGEYTVNYKISATGYDDLEGSNKVKIYGIKQFNPLITLKEDKLVIKENSYLAMCENITLYSTSNEIRHYNKNNIEDITDTLKTGDIIKVHINGTVAYEYRIVYLGDTSGDGKINYLDYVNVYNHIQKTKNSESTKKLLESEYLLAGDMSGDNRISYLDYVKIYNKIKELKGGVS